MGTVEDVVERTRERMRSRLQTSTIRRQSTSSRTVCPTGERMLQG